jgi:zinc protease
MIDYTQNPASYDYRLQGFSLQKLSEVINDKIPVYGYSDTNIEISYLEFVFSTGKLTDTNKAISAMLGRLFSYLKTSQNKTLFELLEFHGAKLSFEASSTHSSVKIYELSCEFKMILNEVSSALKNPFWDEESFEHCQNTLTKDIKTRHLEKKTIGDRTFNHHFYQGTKLASPLLLTDINELKSQDIVTKIDSLFNSLDFVLTVNVVGDTLDLTSFEFENHRSLISNIFPSKEVKVISKLNEEQSLIQLIKPLCSVHSDRYPLYYFYNQILGGSFQSILSQEIREKQGLTYGIHSSLLSVNNDSYLKISSTTPYKKGEEVLSRIDEITGDFGAYLNKKYLNQIKKVSSASFLKNMENTFSQLALQKNILLSELTSEFYSKLLEGIKEVTISDLIMVNEELNGNASLKIVVE